MIVKNESKIIRRLFDSVVDIIGSYCICDTGSTDDTVRVIEEYMKNKKIPGEVIREPFKNFGYNRTFALKAAQKWGKYALLLDADMILKVEDPSFFKDRKNFTKDGYTFIQKAGDIVYYNVRLVRTDIGVTCVGPTHEYYNFVEGKKDTTNLHNVFIQDIGDGGAKADKFERDARLLEEALIQEPNNPRHYFYLGNSYKSLKKFEKAIKCYKKRIEIGGWDEEVFYARYEIGNCFREQSKPEEAIFWYLEAYNYYPKRAETLYEIVNYYRVAGKNVLAKLFCDQALKIPYPKNDLLFIRSDIYNYKLDYENSIISYYTQSKINHYKYLNLLGYDDVRDSALSNYKFYSIKLCDATSKFSKVYDFTETLRIKDEIFNSSTPCVVSFSSSDASDVTPTNPPRYMMNIRFVNYKIKQSGDYEISDQTGKISTVQKIIFLDEKFKVVESFLCDRVIGEIANENSRYQGVEDLKMIRVPSPSSFSDGERHTFFTYVGTVQNPRNGKITVGGGIYPVSVARNNSVKIASSLKPIVYDSPEGRDCEKNWCLFQSSSSSSGATEGKLKMVYSWNPLVIYDYELTRGFRISEFPPPTQNQNQNQNQNNQVPSFFKVLRGSSNGVHVLEQDEIWFMTHFVEYSKPRHYYHMIVVLDAKTESYKRHSIPFKFEGSKIEYSLGLVVDHDKIIMSYSCNDATSKIISMDRKESENILFCCGDNETNSHHL